MAMVQCENRHFYDDRKHTHCPHCPVPGLKDVKIPGTQAASVSRPGIAPTEPASFQRTDTPIRGGSSVRSGGMAGVTIGAVIKRTGIDPVVGWLVCIHGSNKGRDYRLHSDLNKVGRDPNMDVCIEGDETISRENHCQIAFSPRSKVFSIVPGTGRNLIYLNGQDVLSATSLKAYDQLDLGESKFLFLPFCVPDRFDWSGRMLRRLNRADRREPSAGRASLNKPFRRCEYCFRAERDSDGICPSCGFDGVPLNKPPLLTEGTAVGGRYILGRQEGRGGFSICYRAWDGMTDEVVAIKELYPAEVADRLEDGRVDVDPRLRDDFEAAANSLNHEAEVLRKLVEEPSIVRVRDVFRDNDTVYLSMEYLRGRSYDRYLQDQYQRTGTFIDVATAVNVALTVLGALETVHAAGLLHLDLKPANIRVLDSARIVLLDFGSARDAFRVGNGPYGDTFTPGFAAPEQHSVDRSVTAATDVYGVGATLYYSLSLYVPTRADERENGTVLPALSALNPDVPLELDFILQKAMALDPRERYASVKMLKRALEPFGTTDRRLAPVEPGAPVNLRIAAGLFDVVISMLLLAGLVAAQPLLPGQVAVAALLLWWLLQLLPAFFGATPGMLLAGLRLTNGINQKVSLGTLLIRPVMVIASIITVRFRPDANGLLLHDRLNGTRVELVKQED